QRHGPALAVRGRQVRRHRPGAVRRRSSRHALPPGSDRRRAGVAGGVMPDARPGKPTPSMKEVARAVGVSLSTVSRVVNSSSSRVPIGQDTRRRILEAVRTMGYRPDPLARGLRGAGTALLGLIVREISDPFFAHAIEVIAVEARSRRYSLVLGHARSSGEE